MVAAQHTSKSLCLTRTVIILSASTLCCFGKQGVVDGIDEGLGADLASSEVSAVKAFDGIFAALYTVKFQVDVTLRVWIHGDVDYVTVLVIAFMTDIVFQFFHPAVAFFPVRELA